MSFDFDDEDQNVPYAYYTPGTNRAPLQENIGASSTSERFGLDLVAVLDVSYSMTRENRLNKMKTAMQFVIKKLSPMDRLSIVTFSGNAKRLCLLRSVTKATQSHLKDLVDGLRTSSATNIQAGLETGLNVLNDRRIAGGRVISIFLFSDGDQNEGDATIVDVSDVAVYTFGFGADTNHKDTVQNVWLVPHTATNTAPLQVNMQQVMLELIDASSTGERFGLDLVAVLDVSESMDFPGNHRLGKMKTAMQFVIKKLSPMDRLSIVTFSDVAKRLCPLRSVTQVSHAHLMDLVDSLTASGRTNIEDGLRTGHKVLTDRRIARGRIASIFLLSDGDQNQGDATIVDVSDVAVYTFGFGADYDPMVLDEIARKSKGGTFSFVGDEENMSEPFSQILGGLLSVVLQDLKLTVSPHPGDSTIEKVNAGLYQQTRNANTGSVTVSFGDLFTTEVRRIIVDVLLPAVHRKKKVTAIIAYCTYSIQGKPFVSRELTVTISRTGSVVPNVVMKPEAMRTELARRRHANYLEEARTMADNKDLENAKNKLVEAKNDLELEQTNTMIEILRTHLDKLLELTRFPGLRAYLRSLKTSHDRQRIAATGDVKGDRLFDTHITGIVRGEAQEFVKNPTMELRPIGHDFIEAKQQGMERPPPMMEARTWRTWCWGDWKSHHESSRWAWAMVILCMVLAVGLIVIGVTLFTVYLIYKPKMPHLVVSDAQLGALQYAQQDGTIQYLQLAITILALQFHGVDVALLRTPAPIVVAPESSLPLHYNVVSAGRTLDPAGMRSMDESLSAGVVPFDLRGKARTRWKVGIFLKVHFWTRISCRLHFFFPGNSTVMSTDLRRCRSR